MRHSFPVGLAQLPAATPAIEDRCEQQRRRIACRGANVRFNKNAEERRGHSREMRVSALLEKKRGPAFPASRLARRGIWGGELRYGSELC